MSRGTVAVVALGLLAAFIVFVVFAASGSPWWYVAAVIVYLPCLVFTARLGRMDGSR